MEKSLNVLRNHGTLCTKTTFERPQKVGIKLGTYIRNYWQRVPMKLYYILNVQWRIIFRWMRNYDENEMGRFRQTIHNNPNLFMLPTGTRQTYHKFDVDIFLLPSCDINILGYTSQFLVFDLDFLGIWAESHKVCYVPFHFVPPINHARVTIHFCDPPMDRLSGLMDLL